MSETIEDVREDANAGFRYDPDERYQKRAHDYLERRRVARSWNDTAVQCEVLDLVRRAYEAGLRDSAETCGECAGCVVDGKSGFCTPQMRFVDPTGEACEEFERRSRDE